MELIPHRALLKAQYALVNPIQVPGSQYQALKSTALVPRGMERHARMMPRLLHLDTLREEERLGLLDRSERWLQQFGNHLLPVFIETRRPLASVVQALLRSMLITDQRSKRHWLRLHDPRVLRHLAWLLDEAQLQVLLTAGDVWNFHAGDDRAWQQIVVAAPTGERNVKLALDAEQWNELALLGSLNDVMEEMALDAVTLNAVDISEAMRLLKEAQSQGIDDDAELRIYALTRLRSWISGNAGQAANAPTRVHCAETGVWEISARQSGRDG
ncbi:DUF4123 domain-containing protein [[Pseudomonas] boreopolis]|uniref:DUF4123 domain-containing protein n=1 Tax=Xanthomonas boreopolis TaxID=86183 RepID=UPI003DA15EF2